MTNGSKEQAAQISKKIRDKNNSTLKTIEELEKSLISSRIPLRGGHMESVWATDCFKKVETLKNLTARLNETILETIEYLERPEQPYFSSTHDLNDSLGIMREYREQYGIHLPKLPPGVKPKDE